MFEGEPTRKNHGNTTDSSHSTEASLKSLEPLVALGNRGIVAKCFSQDRASTASRESIPPRYGATIVT